MPGSGLSLATTAYDIELNPAQPDNADEKPSYRRPQYFLRWPEVTRTIQSVARFRLCSAELALAAGIDLPEPPTALEHPRWTWKPRSARKFDTQTIASHLISESEGYLRLVSFEDWVQEASGSSSSTVRSLEFKYEGLSVILYYYLKRHLEEYQKYVDLKKILEEYSDPYLLCAV